MTTTLRHLQNLIQQHTLNDQEYYSLIYSIRPALMLANKLYTSKEVASIISMKASTYSLWIKHTNITPVSTITTITSKTIDNQKIIDELVTDAKN